MLDASGRRGPSLASLSAKGQGASSRQDRSAGMSRGWSMKSRRVPRSGCALAAHALVLATAALAGCGSGDSRATAHLQGTVTLNGQPLPAEATGSVTFIPTSKEQAPAATAELVAGKYDCPAAPQGAIRVSFNVMQPTGPEYTTDRGTTARQMTNIVPAEYATGIDVEITGDDAALDFDMKSAK